jgi:hypothetical protein
MIGEAGAAARARRPLYLDAYAPGFVFCNDTVNWTCLSCKTCSFIDLFSPKSQSVANSSYSDGHGPCNSCSVFLQYGRRVWSIWQAVNDYSPLIQINCHRFRQNITTTNLDQRYSILLFASTDVSITKIYLDTSILAKNNTDRREYCFFYPKKNNTLLD